MRFKERKKRVYTSMFDPFREDIEKWCNAGLTLKEAYGKLPEGYSFGGFYSYLRAKGIRGGSWGRAIDAKNVCNKCEYCKTFQNENGGYNKEMNRICTKHWRLVRGSVVHSPTWCSLNNEGKEVEERTDGKENS